jgi:TPR repeat protein
MRISSITTCALVALLSGAGAAIALDAPLPAKGRVPAASYASASEAMRSAARELNAGDPAGAVQALEYAAKQGHPLAQWKLGRMHASGEGVPLDDLKAFEYFSKIADDYADESPDSPNAPVVANAFVALGTYFLDGIKGTYVKPNAERAHEMFHYAATYFGNPHAQYSLARLYLEGTGVGRDPRTAARWFNLAAEKSHPPAQAVLGHMLFNGLGIPRQRVSGLTWLMMASDTADPAKDRWIAELHQKAVEAATESERQRAQAFLDQHQKKKR